MRQRNHSGHVQNYWQRNILIKYLVQYVIETS